MRGSDLTVNTTGKEGGRGEGGGKAASAAADLGEEGEIEPSGYVFFLPLSFLMDICAKECLCSMTGRGKSESQEAVSRPSRQTTRRGGPRTTS